MALGISGDSGTPSISGQYTENLMLVELRTMNNLIQSLLGNGGQGYDEIKTLRNDQGWELGLITNTQSIIGN